MELLSPGPGLIIWQITILLVVLLFVVSWTLILNSRSLDSRDRLSWLLGTALLPVLGPLLFLVKYARAKRMSKN